MQVQKARRSYLSCGPESSLEAEDVESSRTNLDTKQASCKSAEVRDPLEAQVTCQGKKNSKEILGFVKFWIMGERSGGSDQEKFFARKKETRPPTLVFWEKKLDNTTLWAPPSSCPHWSWSTEK